ncbi:MAG: aminotransferase class IV [Rhodospirillales bacterium]|nr:aminotransferase class IV [Rhodospirillales bacterium]MDH3793190.1 aminotransferase class IV [Rhodospirillales bacterium]MDH3913459.1 aminotransferase class IV [Rhodospirillales bacterium]MDH3918908.1 aminotransferase class IV [Rhodospirillales bacterium]MDH3968900.1 aminotransferase class IV [Rhodospirillales bacterium]
MSIGSEQRKTQAAPQFPPGIAYIDGRFRPISEAKISVLDWGFLRSDATYDVVHVWQRRFFRLDAHLDRFLASVAKLRLSLPFDRATLAETLKECVRRSGLDDAYVEMICTRGFSPDFSRDPRAAVNRFIAFAIPFGWIADAEQRRRGLHLAIAEVRRIPPQSVDPRVKNYHWLDLVTGLFEAYDRGAENVLLCDLEGNVTEGAGFNLFAVSAGRVTTPSSGVLEGITRATVLELCAELGVPAGTGTVSAEALVSADEVFVTSTAGGIMPVARIDGAAIGDGTPGRLTGLLTQLYWAKHEDPAWTTPVD